MVEYLGAKNQFNVDTIQLKIDYDNKTYSLGQFTCLSKRELTSKKKLYAKVEELKLLGFKEV